MPAVSMTECHVMLKALGDPTRLKVVRQLIEGPCRVAELDAAIEVEQSLLSHHLKVLREAGMVEAERNGKGVLYRIAPEFRSHTRAHGIDFGCCRLLF